MRGLFVGLAAWLLFGDFAIVNADESPLRPNIVIILTDDLGYGDLGCYGAKDIQTPNLDCMATEGIRFTDFAMSAPLCTPSRVSLMSGCYPGRFGLATGVLRPNATNGLPSKVITLAEIAKSQGYATGCIGKWHLGFRPGMRPMDQGFDTYYGVLHNLDRYETKNFDDEGGMPILRGNTVVERPAVPAKMTGLYTTEALRFIEKNQKKPFFLYLGHAMPHLPYDASDRFKGTSKRGLYGDVVQELDWSTGQVLDRLRALDLAEKTLVFFTSDNGPERKTPGTAKPLSGTKHTVYEGGIRVPMIAWWPKTISKGSICDEFTTCMDIFPTMKKLVGSKLPLSYEIDGFDISKLLLDPKSANGRKPLFFTVYGRGNGRKAAIRSGYWKLHLGKQTMLFNLRVDLAEQQNLAESRLEIVESLQSRYRELLIRTTN